MDYMMLIKIAAIIIIGSAIWFSVIKGIMNVKREAKKDFMNAVFYFALEQNAKQIEDTCRDESFFKMKNDGDDLCDFQTDIEYVDYIERQKPYMEIVTND